jgi:hypothetical protein
MILDKVPVDEKGISCSQLNSKGTYVGSTIESY